MQLGDFGLIMEQNKQDVESLLDQARSTPDTPQHTSNIRRITIKISQVTIQVHAPHTKSRYAASEDGVRIFLNILILDPTRS